MNKEEEAAAVVTSAADIEEEAMAEGPSEDRLFLMAGDEAEDPRSKT